MIKLMYEFGFFVFCIAGIVFGLRRYSFVDLIMYSYLIFISTMVLTVILAAIFGAGHPREQINGNGNGHSVKDDGTAVLK
jgi:hypothetical protein